MSESRNDVLMLPADDPFAKALESGLRPVIDPTKAHPCGCPGVIHEGGPECHLPEDLDLPKHWAEQGESKLPESPSDSKGAGPFGWNAHFRPDLPEHFVPQLGSVGIQFFYPFAEGSDGPTLEEVLANAPDNPEYQAIMERWLPRSINPGLKKFWETFMPHMPQTGAVMIFSGLVGDTDCIYIRYETDHVKPMTFVLPYAEKEYFFRGWTEAATQEHMQTEMEDWCKHPTEYADFVKKGYRYNFSALAMSPPLGIFFEHMLPIKDIYKGMVTGDFKLLDDSKKQLEGRFNRCIADITRFALELKDKVKFKDHNLMLAFKATEDWKGLTVSLDKIWPKLPEGGQQECGLSPIKLEDWDHEGDNVKVVIRKLIRLAGKANTIIADLYKDLPDNEWMRSVVDGQVKESLFASSHFLKEIYQANPTDIRQQVEETANKVVSALNEHGGNIGLDLTSWVVYQYFEDGRPAVPLVKEGLNFKQELYNTHTERFMEVLFQYLFRIQSPYIRPYVNRVLADKNDGIPVGSIRPVQQ